MRILLVTVDEPQPAQRVEGIVLDPSGAPIPNMTVTDRSEEWVAVLRSTTTDTSGHFRFSSQRGKSVYYLRFDNAPHDEMSFVVFQEFGLGTPFHVLGKQKDGQSESAKNPLSS